MNSFAQLFWNPFHSRGGVHRAGILCCGILGLMAAFAVVCRCAGAEPGSVQSQVLQSLAAAPVYFEANRGQADCSARFIARGRDFNVLLSPTTAQMVLAKPDVDPAVAPAESQTGLSARTIELQFAGANPAAQMKGAGELSGRANYLLGRDPAHWRTGVPMFARVALNDLYPGIDLVYYANREQLEYDFQLQPGVDPKQIAFRVNGADAVRVNAAGDLVLQVGNEEIREHKPVVYQTVNGVRHPVEGSYRLADDSSVGFEIANYDRSEPLVIDPILSFSTYVGGTKGDIAWDVALDPGGDVYVAGETLSSGIATPGAYQPASAGNGHYNGDAFVAKFANGTSNLIYMTYLGGSDDDSALGVAVDAAGNAYVTGFTDSGDFPVANTTVQDHINGHNNNARGVYAIDAFVTKLSPDGSTLLYSTFLGGESREAGNSIAVDASGSAYITGFTESTNFPAIQSSPMHYQTNFGGKMDAFVAKIQTVSDVSSLAYCTYLGGTNQDNGEGISVDATGCAYVTGFTLSTNFPTFPLNNSWFNGQTNKNSQYYDAFFTKFSAAGDSLIYSTYLGGERSDVGLRNAVDANRNLYVTGYTLSTNFPIFPADRTNAFRAWAGRTNNYADVFLTRFSPVSGAEDALYVTNYSLKFGGSRTDEGVAVAVDGAGNAYVTGFTASTNFPVSGNLMGGLSVTNASKGKRHKTNDVFVCAVNADGSAFLYSAYLGGSYDDAAYGIAVDPATGDAYIAGQTTSTNFPTVNPYELHADVKRNTNDAFVAKILMDPALTITQTNARTLVKWPGQGSEYVLESAANPIGTSWTPIAQPFATNGWHQVIVNRTNASSFFRLRYHR